MKYVVMTSKNGYKVKPNFFKTLTNGTSVEVQRVRKLSSASSASDIIREEYFDLINTLSG